MDEETRKEIEELRDLLKEASNTLGNYATETSEDINYLEIKNLQDRITQRLNHSVIAIIV